MRSSNHGAPLTAIGVNVLAGMPLPSCWSRIIAPAWEFSFSQLTAYAAACAESAGSATSGTSLASTVWAVVSSAGATIAPAPDTATQTVDASEVPDVANPADSARAAAYAVSWLKLNSQAGAMMRLQRDGNGIPASTYTPIAVNGAPWFELRIGAYANEADADALLTTMRGGGLLPADQGAVIRAPLAFVIDSASSEGASKKLVATYVARQLPVYALHLAPRSRAGGYGWRLYVGAFTTPIEASLYAKLLRDEGIAPVLVYRIGE